MELSIESSCQYVTWKVRGFFELPSVIGYFLDSPEFRFADDSYCLRLYPNGSSRYRDGVWTVVKLVRLTSTFPERNVSFKIGYRERDEEREVDTYWNELRSILFLKKSILQENGDRYVPDGTFTALFSMHLKEQSSTGILQSKEARTSDKKEQQKSLTGFGAAATSGSLFGNTAPSTQSSVVLLGGSSSAFGTPLPSGFGTRNTVSGLFDQITSTGTSLFGSSGFTTTTPTGTTLKFNPPTGTDTMMKGAVSTSFRTRHQCITVMREYENKSLEELRVEDYSAKFKGGITFKGATKQTGGLFGSTAAALTSGFNFGNTAQSKPLFGTTGTRDPVFFSSRLWSSKMELSIESPCQNVTWKVSNVFQQLSKRGYSLNSSEFCFAGDRYRLQFYSKRTNNGETVDTDLQIVRLTSTFPERIVLYKVGYKFGSGEAEGYIYKYAGALIGDFAIFYHDPNSRGREISILRMTPLLCFVPCA